MRTPILGIELVKCSYPNQTEGRILVFDQEYEIYLLDQREAGGSVTGAILNAQEYGTLYRAGDPPPNCPDPIAHVEADLVNWFRVRCEEFLALTERTHTTAQEVGQV